MKANFKIKAEYIFQTNKKGTAIDVKMVYECDPDLNIDCKKTECGICKHTTNIQYAKRFDIDE